jgi:predicted transposase/invertase (TIGR01784 family)
MAHYLDPKNDLTFKRVFGEHKHLCISLLNSLLPLEKPIVSLEYQTGELIPEIDILRYSIVDVRCTDIDNRQFIVEMQMFWSESFKSRILLNASKAYVKQLDKAAEFKLLQPVYALSFVNETFEKSPEMKDEYYHHYKIVNIKDTEKQIKGLEFVFIELPKFKPQNRAEQKLHELWLRFLTEINESTKEAPEALMNNDFTREAVKYVEIGAYTKGQLDTYDKWKIDIMTERGIYDDAMTKGRADGLAEGLKEGRAKGLREGRVEGKIEVAVQLLKLGIPLDDIIQSTGLTSNEISMLEEK